MKLYLVQHGEAAPKQIDPERPLTDAGRQDVDRLAHFMGGAGIRVQRVIHSGKLRAAQTAERLAQEIAAGVELETRADINPNDPPASIDWVTETRDTDTLVVGHLPFMARQVSHLLVGDEETPVVAYRPGSVVCLERGDDGRWRINWMVRPELIG
jgi:phosphohistidine phosphatase